MLWATAWITASVDLLICDCDAVMRYRQFIRTTLDMDD